MAKYRKKPVEVEAVQFTRRNLAEVMEFTDYQMTVTRVRTINGEMYGEIATLEGEMRANENDWIIKGVKGEFYPCKPDIFKKTYEKVEE